MAVGERRVPSVLQSQSLERLSRNPPIVAKQFFEMGCERNEGDQDRKTEADPQQLELRRTSRQTRESHQGLCASVNPHGTSSPGARLNASGSTGRTPARCRSGLRVSW